MLTNLLERAQRVLVVLERAVLDAVVGSRAVASEARLGVEHEGAGEVSRVKGLVPVGLGAGVVAGGLEDGLVRVHEVAVEGEEGALGGGSGM